jgi:hypothetical protein
MHNSPQCSEEADLKSHISQRGIYVIGVRNIPPYQMLPLIVTALLVYAPTHPKMRIGSDYDGGYVILNLTGVVKYDHIVSGGIGHTNTLEIDMVNQHPGLTCDAYDHSISALPTPDPRITWHKKMVATHNDGHHDDLHYYLNKYRNLFVKMDIEAGEFRWLDTVSDTQLNSIAQLVIEWHAPTHFSEHDWSIMARVAKTHRLVHVHACNCCAPVEYYGTQVHRAIECTYVRKDLEPSIQLSKAPIPGPLDMRNVRGMPEMIISWAPFVN